MSTASSGALALKGAAAVPPVAQIRKKSATQIVAVNVRDRTLDLLVMLCVFAK